MPYTEEFVHSQKSKPKVIPETDHSIDPVDLDRVQSVSLAFTRPNEKGFELGRDDEAFREFRRPDVTGTMVINEYGIIKPWAILANLDPSSAVTVDLDDMRDTEFSLLLSIHNQADNQLATRYIRDASITSFNLSITDTDATLEQSWGFASESMKSLVNTAAHFIVDARFVSNGEDVADEVTLIQTPIADPDTGAKVFRATKIRASVQTELVEGVDFSIAGATLTIIGDIVEADKLTLHYAASTGSSFEAVDDSNAFHIPAKNVEIELKSGAVSKLDVLRLQSVAIAATFDRQEFGEIGSNELVKRVTNSTNVVVTPGALFSDLTLEQVLRGDVAGAGTIIDIESFLEDLDLEIRVYADEAHTTFLAKYLVRNLKVTGGSTEAAVTEALLENFTLESDNLTYTTNEALT